MFATYVGIYKSENSASILRDKTLRGLKKYTKIYLCESNLEGQGVVKNTVNQFSG